MAYELGRRVQAANALPRADFIQKYIGDQYPITTLDGYIITLETSSSISPDIFNQCLRLLESTSRAAYENSSRGWSTKDKIEEMREPDMRYLLVQAAPMATENGVEMTTESSSAASSDSAGVLQGFLSFMLTTEDDMEVVYCYEVHVQDWARGSGMGSKLMSIMADVGSRVGLEKAMLTVFTSNEPAIRLYNRLRFTWYDEEPVAPRKRLRGRLTPKPKPSYVILARDLSNVSP